jgi:hypothetical protein
LSPSLIGWSETSPQAGTLQPLRAAFKEWLGHGSSEPG